LRRDLEAKLGPEYALLVEVMGLLRPYVMQQGLPQTENEKIFQGLVDGDILGHVQKRDWLELEAYLKRGLQQELPVELTQQLKKLFSQ